MSLRTRSVLALCSLSFSACFPWSWSVRGVADGGDAMASEVSVTDVVEESDAPVADTVDVVMVDAVDVHSDVIAENPGDSVVDMGVVVDADVVADVVPDMMVPDVVDAGMSCGTCTADLANDPMNCGVCGRQCTDGRVCVDGICGPDVDVGQGQGHGCVRRGREVFCTGNNRLGSIGVMSVDPSTATPVAVLRDVRSLSVRPGWNCAVMTDNTVRCWGRDYNNVFLSADTTGTSPTLLAVPTPVFRAPLMPLTGVQSMHLGFTQYACLVRAGTGQLQCWGNNVGAPVGAGSAMVYTTPQDVNIPGGVVGVATGATNACAWNRCGELYCWGGYNGGANGDPSGATRFTPQRVVFPDGVSIVRASVLTSTTCAVSASRRVYCFGTNTNGELGTPGGDRNSPQPAQTPDGMPLEGVTDVAMAYRHVCAVAMGQVYCWGQNHHDGNSDRPLLGAGVMDPFRFSAVRVVGIPDGAAVRVRGGSDSMCAVTANGDVYCWGLNSDGQLGTGDTTHMNAARLFRLP